MDLSIITVSYNTKELLKQCLASVINHTKGIDYEIIVIDNASTDGSVEMVKKDFPQVRLIQSKKNLGFGLANNFGAKEARGDYLLLLNSDTIITDSAISNSLQAAKKYSSLGAYTCKLLYEDRSLQTTGGYFPTLWRVFAWQFFFDEIPLLRHLVRHIHPSDTYYSKLRHLDWITGAFMLMPKTAYDLVNGFDPKIFMYAEELELCMRLKEHKLKVIYDPQEAIIHLKGKSSPDQSLALLSEINGIKYIFEKHRPSWQMPFLKLIFRLGSLLRYLLFGIIIQDEQKKSIYAQALKQI